jgi:hypothetical protein
MRSPFGDFSPGALDVPQKMDPLNPNPPLWGPLCDTMSLRPVLAQKPSVFTKSFGHSPTLSDIERGNSPEHPDLSALGCIQTQDSIVGHQLSRAAVEKKQK